MANLNRGQIFLDKQAVNFQGVKPKYFIAMNNANDDDDSVVCFVFNTEHRMEKYHLWCNKEEHKFIIPPKTFSFITHDTAIMLLPERYYKAIDFYQENIVLLDIAPDLMTKQIKNCLDWNYLSRKTREIIMSSFK